MVKKKVELRFELRDPLSGEFGVNSFELTTDSFGRMVEASESYDLPIDTEWKMRIVFFSNAPPTRVFVSYNMEDEELVITEKRQKDKYSHSLPALADGGPIPIPMLLEWMENSLTLVQEWMSW